MAPPVEPHLIISSASIVSFPASYAPMAVAPPNSRVPDRGAPDTQTPRRPRKEAAKCVEHSYGR